MQIGHVVAHKEHIARVAPRQAVSAYQPALYDACAGYEQVLCKGEDEQKAEESAAVAEHPHHHKCQQRVYSDYLKHLQQHILGTYRTLMDDGLEEVLACKEGKVETQCCHLGAAVEIGRHYIRP